MQPNDYEAAWSEGDEAAASAPQPDELTKAALAKRAAETNEFETAFAEMDDADGEDAEAKAKAALEAKQQPGTEGV